MATSSILPNVSSGITATTTTPTSSTSSSSSSTTGVDSQTIAGNFQTFLTLLTTQLKNQNPLDPLDTNQFTQQLVQFAGVEQQLKSNDQLATLVSLQQTAQGTAALNFVGKAVAVDGQTATMSNSSASWVYNVTKPGTATFNITNAAGQTVYTATQAVSPGSHVISWNAVDSNGNTWPDGQYTLGATATDASGATLGISTQVEGTVDSADLTSSPPTLSIDGQDYTLDKIRRVLSTN